MRDGFKPIDNKEFLHKRKSAGTKIPPVLDETQKQLFQEEESSSESTTTPNNDNNDAHRGGNGSSKEDDKKEKTRDFMNVNHLDKVGL